MRLGIKRIAFLVLVFTIFAGGHLRAANEANRVEIDGDRLSVRAEGMPLGDLLMAVEEATGVQFAFDGLVAKKEVFLDFEGLPLSKGIKKIIHPLNFATIYDDAGKPCKVIILGRWPGSPLISPREGADDSAKGPHTTPSNRVSSTPKGSSESPVASKGPPLEKRGGRFHGFSTSETPSADGPTNSQEQAMEGPPVGKAYSMTGPPDTQDQKLEGPPDAGSSDHPPPPDSKPDSKDSPEDGPPVEWKYEVDGPPSRQDT
jgi:hypothetical protein